MVSSNSWHRWAASTTMIYDLTFNIHGQIQGLRTWYRLSSRNYVCTCSKMTSNDILPLWGSYTTKTFFALAFVVQGQNQGERTGYRIPIRNYVNRCTKIASTRSLHNHVKFHGCVSCSGRLAIVRDQIGIRADIIRGRCLVPRRLSWILPWRSNARSKLMVL